MCSFADGKSSLETVQAFFLLSTWKDIDDSSSYLRMGFGRVLSLDLELSALAPAGAELTEEESRFWRSRQRLAMALFVQVRLTSLAQCFKGVLTCCSSSGPSARLSILSYPHPASQRSSYRRLVSLSYFI